LRLSSLFFCQSKAQNAKNFRLRRAVSSSGGPAGQTGQTAATAGRMGPSAALRGLTMEFDRPHLPKKKKAKGTLGVFGLFSCQYKAQNAKKNPPAAGSSSPKPTPRVKVRKATF
jgi:hypothetical protein